MMDKRLAQREHFKHKEMQSQVSTHIAFNP